MSNGKNTLLELIEIAKSKSYDFPDKPISDYTNDELLYSAVFIGINNEIQIKACLIVLNQFPPVKIFVKSLLKKYINQC